ncbi:MULTISPECIES: RNA polymerase factor sigma-70 [unclassified Herbaspirillum]|uniref:RNA polymerase factor sigma-70 n=1 Tax=unclassified Herbaspirillum TaxID=2624150 RepID=UPI00114E92FA|nr:MULTISPECIES: RNA polymerase factor sigma-70 [unclassified Herbaspirillum]MBB5393229.1 RNA polymerase sigma-70 factor (ECF subfamily) [Herbaspirillum sp. SJZ102]TQK04133.1 RNA polymerase sigma-70 factor (ECF subfamily) [Herbaspirillum sp. SJZ130]TQK10082.1 RNA polymerase sigma-70 factor (ECF subfamily) [Herbaspirillum sp. SJZ106]
MSEHTEPMELSLQFMACRAQLRDAAARILGCRQRAEDVVQDAWFKIAELPEDFSVRHPKAFLLQVVRNLAIDRQRRMAIESFMFAEEEEGMDVICHQATPEGTSISRQALVSVARALSTLPERTLRAFELHRLDGYTQREVAERLGVSTTLVNFMIRDAMQCCRKQVA